jgi:hypothetical protein
VFDLVTKHDDGVPKGCGGSANSHLDPNRERMFSHHVNLFHNTLRAALVRSAAPDGDAPGVTMRIGLS